MQNINIALTFVLISSLWLPFRATLQAEVPTQPNIVFVITDDQGYGDLACHGHPFLQTPHLDRLYSQSLRFTDYQVSPTCAPTRGALMSGLAPFKVGITHTILERERMALSATTIAEVLRDAGYATGIFGKWHLGDADPYQPDKRGFTETFIHGAGGIGQNFPGTQGAAPGTSYWDPIIKHNGSFVKTKGYCTDVFFGQALRWMKTQSDEQKPFLAFIPTNAPHGPFLADQKYIDMYIDQVPGGKKKKNAAAFFGMITNIDENMGILMEKLDAWGLSDNTLLIFTTDNGTALGGKIFNAGMLGQKNSNHEGGTRVPLFMRLPGLTTAGVEVDRLTRHYDLFPTLAEIANAPIPADLKLDGRSLVPLIKDPNAEWADRMTMVHKGRWNKAGVEGRWGQGNTDPNQVKHSGFAVRNERFRLTGKETLYDIDADPGQKTNVFAQHPEVASQMVAAFDAWWDEVRPLMVNEDASLTEDGKPFIEQFKQQQETDGIPKWTPPEYQNNLSTP